MVEYQYDAWGRWLNQTTAAKTSVGSTLLALNPFLYKGYIYDEESGFYYLKSRYYSPEIKRFIILDSEVGNEGEIENNNLFTYCLNNPVNLADENGKWPKWLKTVLIVAAVVVAVAIVTVATSGIGTAVVGALGVGVAATIIGGAVGGAITGAIAGAIVGAGISIVSQGLSNGYDSINWIKVGADTLTGAVTGAISGAIFGAISGAVKVGQAAKLWDKGTFKSGFQSMRHHYAKHGAEFRNIINYSKEDVSHGIRNASSMTLNVSYTGLQNYWTWVGKVGMNGYFTSAGKIITFWI